MRVVLALITVGVSIYAFIDCVRSTDDEVRNLPRPVWLLVTLIPLAGGLAWLTYGRPLGGPPIRRSARPIAPDDDPEFLLSLDQSFRERRRQAAEEARRQAKAEAEASDREARDRESRRGDDSPA